MSELAERVLAALNEKGAGLGNASIGIIDSVLKNVIEITSIKVVNTGGSDNVYLQTKGLSNPIWPFQGSPALKLDSAPSETDNFVNKHFPNIEYKKIKG